MNINLLNSHESANYLNMFLSQGCLSFQNSPIRYQNCLDHVFSNITASYVHCKRFQNQITDHAMLDIRIDMPNTHGINDEKEIRFTNENKFQKELRRVSWEWVKEDGMNEEISVNDDFERLFEIIESCRSRATKIKTIKNSKQTGRRKKRQPWMTADLPAHAN